MRKFLLEKGPYLRSVDEKRISTERMMIDVIIALAPIILFGWIFYGIIPFAKGYINFYGMIKPFLNVLVGAASSLVFESLYFLCFKKSGSIKNALLDAKNSFALIPGIILALILPVNIQLYVIVYGCFFANIVFKMLFGGLGHNIFNPALIGYAIAVTTFSGLVAESLDTQSVFVNQVINISATSTPLAALATNSKMVGSFLVDKNVLVNGYGGLFNMFIGLKNGMMGEVSGVLCVAAFIYLLVRRVINWRVPVFYVGGVYVLTYLVAIVNKIEGPALGIWFPTFNVVTGGLLFGAVFMATEPVTTPKTPNGKIIFALGCAVFTVLFRLIGMFNEGVCTALLFMSLFTPIIDKFAAKNRGSIITSKMVLRYLVLFILFGLISFYTIYKTTSVPKDDYPIVEIDVNNYMMGDDYNG